MCNILPVVRISVLPASRHLVLFPCTHTPLYSANQQLSSHILQLITLFMYSSLVLQAVASLSYELPPPQRSWLIAAALGLVARTFTCQRLSDHLFVIELLGPGFSLLHLFVWTLSGSVSGLIVIKCFHTLVLCVCIFCMLVLKPSRSACSFDTNCICHCRVEQLLLPHVAVSVQLFCLTD